MSLMPWRQRASTPNVTSLQSEINRMFDDFFNYPAAPRSNEGTSSFPALDVKENDESIVVTAELPGVENKDVVITVRDNVLTTKGEKRAETKEEKDNYHFVERSYGQFTRRIQLPSDVDSDKAEATMEKGVLTLRLPKSRSAEAKTISVR